MLQFGFALPLARTRSQTSEQTHRRMGMVTSIGWIGCLAMLAVSALSNPVTKPLRPGVLCAVDAAVNLLSGLDSVADDFAIAMGAHRRTSVDSTFEAVEAPDPALHSQLQGLVVLVSADIAASHIRSFRASATRMRPGRLVGGGLRMGAARSGNIGNRLARFLAVLGS